MFNMCMESYSTSLTIREMQVRPTISYHITSVTLSSKGAQVTNIGEAVEKREPLNTVSVNWCSHYGKQYGIFWKLIELPCDPAIPVSCIYPKKRKTLIRKYTCNPMFIATLFSIAKIWKQPKCPWTHEWIRKMWYIYTMEYLLNHNKGWNFALWSNMGGQGE